MSVSISSIERKIGASSPVKTIPISSGVFIAGLVFQEDVTPPDDMLSDMVPVDDEDPDHVSISVELTSETFPDDVVQESKRNSEPDNMRTQEELTLLHEPVVSTVPEKLIQDVSHELVVSPDDVVPVKIIPLSHPDHVDISHEEVLHESLVVITVQVVDPVDGIMIEQS